MSTKRERVKAYINEHLVVFSVVGGATIAGFTYVIMRGRYEALANSGAYGSKTIESSITMRPLLIFSKGNNVVNVVKRNGRGHPGYLIRSIDTNTYFSSQREAAKVFGISETLLSKHLNGILENAEGYVFERICMAA